jgi:putative holliday junction resolvase
MTGSTRSVIALDVGERRVGVSLASLQARLARPLTTLDNTDTLVTELQKIIAQHGVRAVVIGLPRGLDGQQTGQTTYARDFAKTIKAHLKLPQYWQDEAVTSKKAEAELRARGKPYARADVDALAATYILEDFLTEHPELRA